MMAFIPRRFPGDSRIYGYECSDCGSMHSTSLDLCHCTLAKMEWVRQDAERKREQAIADDIQRKNDTKRAEIKRQQDAAAAAAAEKKRQQEAVMSKIKKRQDDKSKIDETAPIESLLERAYTELRYKNWYKAELYFEMVLELDSKLPRDRNLTSVKRPADIMNHENYKHAIADAEVKSRLDGYIKAINDRIRKDK